MILLQLWLLGGVVTLLTYGVVSLWHDRELVVSPWILLWLTAMLLLGPLGALLTLRFLWSVSLDVRKEARLERQRRLVVSCE